MGGHLMPSGEYCPPSRSTTSGTGIPHVFQYANEGKDFTVLDIDFSRWVVFWADERCVAQTDPASNFKCAQVYAVDHLPPAQAASTYEAKIAGLSSQILPIVNGMPQLDLIMLGVGPDGHTASLFPNKK
eukprot:gene9951-11782_t